MIRKCEQCGKLFFPKRATRKICSLECQEERRRKMSLESFYRRKAANPKRQDKIPTETYAELIRRMANEKRPHGNRDAWSIRIWDKERHEWYGENALNVLPYYGFDPCCGEVVLMQRWPLPLRVWGHLEADRCAGICDKKGEPIYEHDVIITDDGHDFLGNNLILWEVIWSEDARYSLKPLNAYEENYRKDFFDFNDPTKEWEVVGHTHEELPKWFCPNCLEFFMTGKYDDDDDLYEDICPYCGCVDCVPTRQDLESVAE